MADPAPPTPAQAAKAAEEIQGAAGDAALAAPTAEQARVDASKAAQQEAQAQGFPITKAQADMIANATVSLLEEKFDLKQEVENGAPPAQGEPAAGSPSPAAGEPSHAAQGADATAGDGVTKPDDEPRKESFADKYFKKRK